MGLTGRRKRSGMRSKTLSFCVCAVSFLGSILIGASLPAFALELSEPQAALYSTVSIFPPSAKSMTVCYGFVCRRREILDFTPGDRNTLTQILAAGRGTGGGAEGRSLVRSPHGGGDRDRQARRQGGFPLLRRQA